MVMDDDERLARILELEAKIAENGLR